MPKDRFVLLGLVCAAFQAQAFNVGVTADPLRAEIDNRPVTVSIVHGCSEPISWKSSEYDADGRLLAATGYGYNALGNRVLTVRDADGDGAFTLSGADAATSNATRYVKLDGDWWREATAFTFPVSGSSEAIPVSRTRERLTGLGTVTENGCLVSETRSLTYPSAAETVTRTYADRESRTSLTVTESPASELPARAFSVGGLLVSNVTATGVSTAYAYDALGRTASVTDGRGNMTTYAYDEYGNLVSQTDATGATTTYAYDALNRRISVTTPSTLQPFNSSTTYTAYDAEGRVIAQWGATYPVLYSYDDFGRLVALSTTRDEEAVGQLATDHWSLATDTSWDTTYWLYDESTGLLTNKLYADGLGPSYAYTPDGRLATRAWARGVVTAYSYDFSGNLTNVMHNGGGGNPVNPVNPVETTYTYDRSGHQLSAIVPGVSTNLYSYSLHGQLTNEVQNGAVIARTYDSLARPTGYSLRASAPLRLDYSYDPLGRFSGVGFNAEAQSGEVDFDYSYLPGTDLVSGYTTSSTSPQSGGNFGGSAAPTSPRSGSNFLTRSVAYERRRDLIAAVTNSATNPSTLQPFNPSTFAYANDAAGRRVEVTRTGAAFGALAGATDAYGYNARSEVVSARRTIGNSEVRGFDYDYAYDPIGNRTSATYYDEQGEAVASAYTANALNQYTQRTVPGNVQIRGEADTAAIVTVNENPTWRSGEYFYGGDYADNAASPVFKELEIAAVVPASSPDGWDEMSAVTGRVFVAQNPEQFTYDADGNMLTDGRFRYTWNAENRLVRAQELYAPTNRNPYTVSYAYDHRGRMVKKEVRANDGHDTLVKSIAYVWDGWNVIRETVTNPSTLQPFNSSTDYVWGLDLDGTMQGAGGVGGLLAVIRSDSNSNSNSSLYFPTYDANGNVSEYVTTNGEIVAHYDYSPFGETLIESGDLASTFTHRFSTKPWCPITGLYEYQMRKYRPEIGRWLSRDPIGKKRVFGLYVFVDNSPISKIDDKGLASWLSTRNRRVDSLGCGTFSMSENFQLLSSDNINSDGTIVQNMYIEIKAYYCDGTTMQNSNNSYSEAFATDGANAEDVFALYFQYDNHCGSYGTAIWEGYATYYDKMPYYSIYDGSENPGWGDFWTIDPVNNPGAGNLPFHSYPFALNTPVPTEGLHRYLKFEWNCCVEEKRFDYSYLSISSRTRKRSD